MHTRETSFWGVLKSFITLLSNETFGIWARFWLWSDGMERCSYSKKRGRVRSELSQLQSSVNWKILKPDQRKSLSACESCRWFFKNTAAHVFLYIGWLDKWEVRIDSLWVSITVNPLASQIALVRARAFVRVCVCHCFHLATSQHTFQTPAFLILYVFTNTQNNEEFGRFDYMNGCCERNKSRGKLKSAVCFRRKIAFSSESLPRAKRVRCIESLLFFRCREFCLRSVSVSL